MQTSKFVLPLALLAGASAVLLQYFRVRDLSASLATVTAERNEFQSRLALQSRTLQQAVGKQSKMLPSSAATTPRPKAVDPGQVEFDRRGANWTAKLERARTLGRNADLIWSLNLNPEQRGQFADLLNDRARIDSDLRMGASELKLPMDAPEIQQMRAEQNRAVDAKMEALLGPAAFAKFQADLDTAAARRAEPEIRESIGGYLVDAGERLTEAQTAALAVIAYTAHKATVANPDDALKWNSAAGFSNRQAPMIAAAAKVLTPAQLEIYKRFYREQNELMYDPKYGMLRGK